MQNVETLGVKLFKKRISLATYIALLRNLNCPINAPQVQFTAKPIQAFLMQFIGQKISAHLLMDEIFCVRNQSLIAACGAVSKVGKLLPNEWYQAVFYFLFVFTISIKFFLKEFFFVLDSFCNYKWICEKNQKRIYRTQHKWH